MNTAWNNLRPWGKDNSQNDAFEALCCQLAEYESVPDGSLFTRKGAPDAGLECYWTFPTNAEWGWQAKFFFSPPGEAQWLQIDSSVQTALSKHPHLTKLTICVPIDQQDPRIPKRKDFKNEWDGRVAKWKKLAEDQGRDVIFEYWGEHQIFERLSRKEHAGRNKFWFNAALFDEDWFKKRWEEAKESAVPRYSTELNVQLPIAKVFDALGRTEEFDSRLELAESELLRKLKLVPVSFEEKYGIVTALDSELSELHKKVTEIADVMRRTRMDKFAAVLIDTLTDELHTAQSISWSVLEKLEVLKEQHKRLVPGVPATPTDEQLDWERHPIRNLLSVIGDALELVNGAESPSTATRALCVIGEAGAGSTKDRTGNGSKGLSSWIVFWRFNDLQKPSVTLFVTL
jgi:hypothetical protein